MSDVSDADRLEQELPIVPPDSPVLGEFEPEAPEADAVEQALPAPIDDEEHR
ncbi:MAG: hypothetical protein M3314_05500 [Actinomycetota bacterium]|nr:hypothetical protein [Actinomycetota bacterium]